MNSNKAPSLAKSLDWHNDTFIRPASVTGLLIRVSYFSQPIRGADQG